MKKLLSSTRTNLVKSIVSNYSCRFSTLEANSKLNSLRGLMNDNGVQAYLIPHTDPHMSEYVPVCDEWVSFISGFTGSNALCLVTQSDALCWTDSRYFLQCEKQLEPGWKMMKMLKGQPTWFEWTADTLKNGEKLGYDPFLLTIDTVENRSKYLKEKGIEFVPLKENLVAKLWTDRPAPPSDKVYIFDEYYAGESAKKKLLKIGQELKEKNCQNYLITDLCEIAWTLNLRGNDSENTPFFISYLWLNFSYNEETITPSGTLFINPDKVPQEVVTYLKDLNITVRPYNEIQEGIADVQSNTYITRTSTNAALYQSIKNQGVIVGKPKSIVEQLKAVKNPKEIQGFRDAHVRDGAAIVRYLAWLDHSLNHEGRTDISEHDGAMKLQAFRAEHKLYKGNSFAAISSIGANAAIVHYKPDEKTASIINNKEIYLLDSGGQYLDGTTDTTRTVHFGTPTAEEKDAYTRVLLGNLDIERVVFPSNGTYGGADIDVLARRHLWAKDLDFGHGTGHGVGHFLNVHEGPHAISKHRSEPFVEGMVVTNEPGYYKDGQFGIRIENMLVVQKKNDKFFQFENFTLVPFESALIDLSLLSKADIDFINNYHEKVYRKLIPVLEQQNDTIAIEYLKKKTKKLTY